MTPKIIEIVIIAIASATLVACPKSPSDDKGPSTESAQADSDQKAPKEIDERKLKSDTPDDTPPGASDLSMADFVEVAVPPEARVPNTMFVEDECDVREQAPDACTWAQTADAIVVAEIRDIRLAVDKVIGADGKGGWRWYEDCQIANPALVIDLNVQDVLAGDVSKTVSLRVGWAQLQHFRPLPYARENGELAWTAVRSEAAGPLISGNRVVLGLHRIDDDWSLMGDTILGIDAGDKIYVPRRPGDCLTTTPDELASLTTADAAALLGRCGTSAAVSDRRKLQSLHWGREQNPAFYVAGYCTDEIPGIAVEPDGRPTMDVTEVGTPSKPPERDRQ